MSEQPRKIVIIIGGNAGHGKDTLAGTLALQLGRWADTRVDAYAWALKQVVHLKTGIPMDILLGDKELKESYVHPLTGKTARQLLQDEGETTRRDYGYLVWAWGTRERARFGRERITIITDARHPKEELHWMRDSIDFARVFLVKIRRASVPVLRGHPSEDFIADEPDSTFDFIIENDGTKKDLAEAARELARACVLLAKTGKKKVKVKGDGWGSTNGDVEPLEQHDAETYCVDRQDLFQLTYPHLKGGACS